MGGFRLSDRRFQLEFLFLVDTRECRELKELWKLEELRTFLWGSGTHSDAVCCAHCVWDGLSFSSPPHPTPPHPFFSFRAAVLSFVCADEHHNGDKDVAIGVCQAEGFFISLARFPFRFVFAATWRGGERPLCVVVWTRSVVQ